MARILGIGCISTRKENDIHTFNPEDFQGLQGQYSLVFMDDIFNNGETLRQILDGLRKFGLLLHKGYFMVDRNPEKSAQS